MFVNKTVKGIGYTGHCIYHICTYRLGVTNSSMFKVIVVSLINYEITHDFMRLFKTLSYS